jgi:hypothetical protein
MAQVPINASAENFWWKEISQKLWLVRSLDLKSLWSIWYNGGTL